MQQKKVTEKNLTATQDSAVNIGSLVSQLHQHEEISGLFNKSMPDVEKKQKSFTLKDLVFLASLLKINCRLLRVEGWNRQLRNSSIKMLMQAAKRVKCWLKPVEVVGAMVFIQRNPDFF